ncbi:hypothetical protein HMPREF9443_00197 [Phascolarctobacterium succinatutens YIT 12067]|uniref:Uncharacterized protein n=1 Tax=Phascolarctobacterium succinatutens YIT 12067 TaxID=626939 RepID=E8LBI6_9FIRM|nr:hypothetical protein HMPREF9443_00197 [Phascolarctobacterium succinatutens YIT 12067]
MHYGRFSELFLVKTEKCSLICLYLSLSILDKTPKCVKIET